MIILDFDFLIKINEILQYEYDETAKDYMIELFVNKRVNFYF